MADQTSTLSVRVQTGQAAEDLKRLALSLTQLANASKQVGTTLAASETQAVSTAQTLKALAESNKSVARASTEVVKAERAAAAERKRLTQEEVASSRNYAAVRKQLLADRVASEQAASASVQEIRAREETAASTLAARTAATRRQLAADRTAAAELEASAVQAINARALTAANAMSARAAQVRILNEQRAADAAKAAAAERMAVERATTEATTLEARQREQVRAREVTALKAMQDRAAAARAASEARASQITAQAASERQAVAAREATAVSALSDRVAHARAMNEARATAEAARQAEARIAIAAREAAAIAAMTARTQAVRAHMTTERAQAANLADLRTQTAAAAMASRAETTRQTILEERAATAQAARAALVTGAALRDSNLAQTVKVTKELNASRAASIPVTKRSSDALRQNSLAMREAHSVARGLSGSLGTLWMTYGAIAPLLGGAVLGSMARNTYQVGKDLQYRLRFVEALGNAPIELDKMMGAVKGSMKTPLEAAEALQALAQAGLDSNQSLAALASTMQLSTLGELGMQEAVYAMTGSLAAFNLQAAEAARVGDVFAKAASMSNTSVEKITGSMRQASSAAASYNVSLEETSAALVMMAKQNIVGTMAGTSYRNMLKELYTPIARGAKALDKLGISAYDAATKRMRPLSDVLVELQTKLVGLDAESRNKALEAIFGERGARAIRPILANLEEYLETIRELDSAQGFLAESAAKLIDTVEGAANRMQSTMQQAMSNAFGESEASIKSLILSLDRMFASEGFTESVTIITQGITYVTKALVDNAKWLTTLTLLYVGFKSASLIFATAQRASTNLTTLFNAALTRSTASLTANTAAVRANASAAAMAGAANRGVASGFVGVARAASSAAGYLWGAYAAYTALSALASLAGDRLRGGPSQLRSLEDEGGEYVAKMLEQAEGRRGVFEASLEKSVGDRKFLQKVVDEIEDIRGDAAVLGTQLRDLKKEQAMLDAQYGFSQSIKPGQLADFESLYGSERAPADAIARWNEVNAAIAKKSRLLEDHRTAISRLTEVEAKYHEAVDYDRHTSEMQRFVSEQSTAKARVQALQSASLYATGPQGDFLKSINFEHLQAQIKEAKDMEGLAKILPQIEELHKKNDSFLQSMSFDDPKKGRVDPNAPEGLLASVLRSAGRMTLKDSGDILKANEKVTRSLVEAQQQLNEQYMTDDVIYALRAREKAENAFNNILDARKAKIEEINEALVGVTDQKSIALAQERIAALQRDIANINTARDAAGQRAQAQAHEMFLRDQTLENGIERLFTKYRNEGMRTADTIAAGLEDAFNTAGDALAEFARTGKINFRELTVSILSDMSKIASKMASSTIFGLIAKSIAGAIAGASMPANISNSMDVNLANPLGSAKGNVFHLGRVVPNARGNPYTNGIVSRPTLAPMALFGEAGEEAIMPLTRTSDGNLGVRAIGAGGGGTGPIYVETNVYIQQDGSARTEVGGNNDTLMRQLGEEISAKATEVVRKHLSQGGMIRNAIMQRA